MAEILIVDDDGQLRSSFEKLLTAEGHLVRTASSGEAGLEAVQERIPDLVVMDVRMPGMDGLEAFEAMHRIEPRLPVVIMTAYGSTDTAIKATKLGAYDYILKPFDIPDVLELISQALEAGRFMRAKVALTAAPGEEDDSEALIGQSRAMNEVYKSIGRVAGTDALVLIRGESGTGKELVARAIFQHSQRSKRPFMIINCVAIPDTLLESELFGYEKGAFTGATQRRIGKIEQANHGAVFLDEIGDMPVNIQAKILRLLQEKKIERLGGRETIDVDVRIIAATNRDLEAAVAEGAFREDLYYRLKVVTLTIPPLRDRKEDIPQLANYFLRRFARDMDMDNPGLTKEALEALMEYNWPGNVRELANALQKTLVFSRGGALGGPDVLKAVGDSKNGSCPLAPYSPDGPLRDWVRSCLAAPGDSAFDTCMDQIGRLVIREALEITDGNRTRAAKLLGLSRPTLLAKIEKYGLRIKAQIS